MVGWPGVRTTLKTAAKDKSVATYDVDDWLDLNWSQNLGKDSYLDWPSKVSTGQLFSDFVVEF